MSDKTLREMAEVLVECLTIHRSTDREVWVTGPTAARDAIKKLRAALADSADAPLAIHTVATKRLRDLSLLSAFLLDDVEEGWPADVVAVLRRYSGASDSTDAPEGPYKADDLCEKCGTKREKTTLFIRDTATGEGGFMLRPCQKCDPPNRFDAQQKER